MIYTVDEIRDIVTPIAKKYQLKAVYLFGSYARGDATESSDIDLLMDTSDTPVKTLFDLGALYCDLEDALQKPIDLITVNSLLQTIQIPSELSFREAVQRERMVLYAVA